MPPNWVMDDGKAPSIYPRFPFGTAETGNKNRYSGIIHFILIRRRRLINRCELFTAPFV